MNISEIWVFRIVPIQNLECNLRHGLFCKSAGKTDKGFVTIGSQEVISRRSSAIVKCYPNTIVNDYVPFYFSVRTPMLYNIITGYGVNAFRQEDIVYLCFKLDELTTSEFQWCYTDGNAASAITKFYKKLDNIENKLDWHSIITADFRDGNADGDEDRVRKKHSEFLVKYHVPVNYIKGIAVFNDTKQIEVKEILQKLNLTIEVKVKHNNEYYFI